MPLENNTKKLCRLNNGEKFDAHSEFFNSFNVRFSEYNIQSSSGGQRSPEYTHMKAYRFELYKDERVPKIPKMLTPCSTNPAAKPYNFGLIKCLYGIAPS